MNKNNSTIFQDEKFKILLDTNSSMVRIIRHGESLVQDNWLTSREVAKILGVSIWTLRQYRLKGKIAYYQYDRRILYQESDVIHVLKQFKVPALVTTKTKLTK